MNLYNVYMFRYDSQKKCTVLYDLNHEVFEVDMLPYTFLDLMCLHHGSSMQGRIDAFKSMLKVEKKVPVLVCRYQGCIFFPTTSYLREDCVWIQEKYVEKVTVLDHGCRVHFINRQSVELEVSNRVVYKQLKRCRMFLKQITTNFEVVNLLDE